MQSEIDLVSRHARYSSVSRLKLEFISIGLSESESVYLRNLSRKESCNLEFGSKNGPNHQFFKSIETICQQTSSGSGDATVLIETDAIPVKPNWLDELNHKIAEMPEFWIAGGRYKGVSSLSPLIKDHINGNAIYGIGASGFREFLNEWKNILRSAVSRQHWVAYDIVLPLTRHKYESDPETAGLSQESLKYLQKSLTMTHDISEVILNISGRHENTTNSIDASLLTESVIICHSRPLARRISWLLSPSKGLNLKSLYSRHPLNQRLSILETSPIGYLNSDDTRRFSYPIASRIIDSTSFLKSGELKDLVLSCLSSPKALPPSSDNSNE